MGHQKIDYKGIFYILKVSYTIFGVLVPCLARRAVRTVCSPFLVTYLFWNADFRVGDVTPPFSPVSWEIWTERVPPRSSLAGDAILWAGEWGHSIKTQKDTYLALIYVRKSLVFPALPYPHLDLFCLVSSIHHDTDSPLYCCYTFSFVIEYNTTQYVLPLFSPNHPQEYKPITRKYTCKYPCVFSQPPSLSLLLCQRPVTNFPSQAHTVHITYRVLWIHRQPIWCMSWPRTWFDAVLPRSINLLRDILCCHDCEVDMAMVLLMSPIVSPAISLPKLLLLSSAQNNGLRREQRPPATRNEYNTNEERERW